MNRIATYAACGCILALCSLGALVGCGGGSSGPTVLTLTLDSTAALDGYATSGGVWNTIAFLVVGDQDAFGPGRGTRALLTFDHTGLPAGATIVSATLRVHQYRVEGTPYATHGTVEVRHLEFAVLDDTAFGLVPLGTAGTLSSDTTLGYKEIDVKAHVDVDLGAARTRSQFRLEFSALDSDSSGDDDAAFFESAENTQGAGDLPQLVITYTAP